MWCGLLDVARLARGCDETSERVWCGLWEDMMRLIERCGTVRGCHEDYYNVWIIIGCSGAY